MIFVTVGSMLPFDRLVAGMDCWARQNPAVESLAQIGAGSYEPRHMPWVRMISREDFVARVRSASLIVAHAGIGSILAAAEFGKPIVLLPRHAVTREHTTDHQIHTAHWLKQRQGIFVASTEMELAATIAEAQRACALRPRCSPTAPEPFLDRVRQFLEAPGHAPNAHMADPRLQPRRGDV